MAKITYTVEDLIYVMRRLRDPLTGCPWDIMQDFASVVPHTLEEAYEVVDAIEQEDYLHLGEELGDLLFQVIFYSQLGDEKELFNFHEVVDQQVSKIITRHPHVFPQGTIKSERLAHDVPEEAQIKENWEAIKQRDRNSRGALGRLADVPHALAALSRAQKLQKRASRHGFDWTEISGVIAKIDEERAELEQALKANDKQQIEEELGDLIFACVNLARHKGLDAEAMLRKSNRKFESRFALMEEQANTEQVEFDDLSADQKNRLWELAKHRERRS